eukprot:gene10770-10926_t
MQQAPWTPADLAGHLEKLGHADYKWRRRFFALKGQQLFYFRSSSSSKPLGVVALNGAAVTAVRPAGRHSSNTLQHHILELQLDSSLRDRNKHTAYKLAAASLELQELWHDALQSATVAAGRPSSLGSMAMTNPGLAVLAVHAGSAAGDTSSQQDELLGAAGLAEPMHKAKRSSRQTVAANRGRTSSQILFVTDNSSNPSNMPRHSSTGPAPVRSSAADDPLMYGKHAQPSQFMSRKSIQSMSAAACQNEGDSDNQSQALARRSAKGTPLSQQFQPVEFKAWHPEAASVKQQADIEHQPQQMPLPHRHSQAPQHLPAHDGEGGTHDGYHGVQLDEESFAVAAEGRQTSGENDNGGGFEGLQASNRRMSVSQHTSSRKLSHDLPFGAAATRKGSVVAEGNRTEQYFRSSSSSVGSSNHRQLRARRHNKRCGA